MFYIIHLLDLLTDFPIGFSTFACKPLINIHDFFVSERVRSKGVAQQMIQHIAEFAKKMGCCKLTLEVLATNEQAKRAYSKAGFKGTYN
jgi:GNAT superfamily N-acetyltransferase